MILYYRISAAVLAIMVLANTAANAASDSSGVYSTRRDFGSNQTEYSCKCRIQEKAGIFWSDFLYEASGDLRVNAKNNKRRWLPGSIYGFYMNGIRYIFIAAEKKYLAVLNNKLTVPLFVKEIEHVGYRYVLRNGLIVYLSLKNGELVELTRKNLQKEFSDDAKLLEAMLSLAAKLGRYSDYISRKNFFKCQQVTLAFQRDSS